jgi:hypothetical protein
LVAQIPSLFLSLATAIIVTRVTTSESMTEQAGSQFSNVPALFISAGILTIMGLVPGMPHLVFLTLAAALRTRARLAGLDYARPVLELQRALAELRAQRLRQLRWAFVTGQVLWVMPFCVVLLRGLTGAPVLEGAVLDFALKGLAWTLALVPLQWLAWRALRRVWRGHNGLTRWGDALAGDDLAELRRLLERLQ